MIRPVRRDGTIDTGGVFVPIPRPRVLDRIAAAAMQRVVLVVAPAGYGKSVALRQFLSTVTQPCVRYDVRPENAGLLGFLRGLADALSDVIPQARATLAGAYERNAASSSPGSDLALWMATHLDEYRGVIAIDDLHIAQDEREVPRFVTALVERTRDRVQWVLASRSTVGLPIGTWLAYGESDLAIDEHDLRFSVDEAKDAARAFRLGVREEELQELVRVTGGWATAISFALRTSTRSVDILTGASATREMIYRYLAEQVFASLSAHERAFLESSVLLERIDPIVMVAAGFDSAGGLIEELRNRVAFIHTERDETYRCHDLFREFVIHQMSLRGTEAIKTERRRLGAVLEGLHRVLPALRIYIDAEAGEQIERILSADGFEMLERGHADIVSSALNILERGGQIAPIPIALRGMVEVTAGHYAEGERHLRNALRVVDDVNVNAKLTIRLALLLINRLDDPPLTLLEELIERPSTPTGAKLEAGALLAFCYSRTRSIDQAHKHIALVEASLTDVHEGELRAKLLQRLGSAKFELSEGTQARALLEESVELSMRLGLWSLTSRAHSVLALVSMMLDYDLSAALRSAQQAAFGAGNAGDYFDLQTSLLMMLSVETRRGNIDRVRQLEAELGELRTNDSTHAVFVAAGQAHRAAWEGRLTDANRLFASVVQRQPHPPDRALSQSIYALCLALEGRSREARVAVDAAVSFVDDERVVLDAMSALYFEFGILFCALAETVSQRHTNAAKILKRSPLSSHLAGTTFRTCVEELSRSARRPQYRAEQFHSRIDALRDLGFGGYSRYLVMAETCMENGSEEETEIRLTPSELRVLRDLAKGMTPKDIAAEMGRSVLTIQTHVQNLIEKLGCHGRAEAIAAARKMGVLEKNGPT